MNSLLILSIVLCLILGSQFKALGEQNNAKSHNPNSSASVPINMRMGASDSWSSIQSLSARASTLFGTGDFSGAERLYLEALELANKANVPPESTAMLACNLAAVLRKESKTDEAAYYFEQAVKICRTHQLKPSVCEYVAKQYGPLLRIKGKNAEADSLLESAINSFSLKHTEVKPEPNSPVGNVEQQTAMLNDEARQSPNDQGAQSTQQIAASLSPQQKLATELADNPPPNTLVNDSVEETVSLAASKGWVPCPGSCLKLATPGWQHEDHPGYAPTDVWFTFHFTGGSKSFSQRHIGHIIETSENGHPDDVGICPVCLGVSWVRK